MQSKVCLITGATSGIGLITAQALAQQGARVVLVGRDATRGADSVERIKQATGHDAVDLLLADLSSQADIAKLAETFQNRYERLDVLVNNAGAIFTERQVSLDGFEMTFALNHLGYFLLTHLLLDRLKASAPSRIVNVASSAHRRGRIHLDDLQGERTFGAWRAYCQSKLANIMFTYELANRLHDTRVTVNTLHPGFVATRFGHNNSGIKAQFLRAAQVLAISSEKGAETMIYLSGSPEVEGVSGKYFVNKHEGRSSPQSYDAAITEALWHVSEAMVGQVR
ncbi:SDR family oxidoreductase [Candidatus Entotheonella palauensis]|uniref:Short-chain dehydrogenase n=1 Tax=Candidatus Entotheonella gemina TaxID=1429439 RepID=W4LTR3_9BACT|nr:SDR family oxidoreductase [Candidatus Entotheonella palauensis]ETX01373.1 MAG: short-chain dehydrogenase [Candidatus Entotheonella gemina]